MQVLVRDNNIDQALRVLKKKMQREGVFREMKRRRFYEKPSEQATRQKAEAVRRARKLAGKQAIRDGLIARCRPQRRGAQGPARASSTAGRRSYLKARATSPRAGVFCDVARRRRADDALLGSLALSPQSAALGKGICGRAQRAITDLADSHVRPTWSAVSTSASIRLIASIRRASGWKRSQASA
jgi:small subunit ribosomal protein S21